RGRGAAPCFGRVVIETSGLADPGPLLQTFATDRALGGEFAVEVALAVVDAVTGPATLDWSAEARKQVILADCIVITKTDLAEPDAIRARVASLNPRAGIAGPTHGDIGPSWPAD